MRWLLGVLLLLVAAVGMAVLLHRYPGSITLEIGPWIVETSAAVGVVALAVLFIAVYLILRFFGLIARAPSRLHKGLRRRRSERARRSLVRGLIEMSEGRWEASERLLVRHADGSSGTALLNYLAAARAAQQIGAYERRDRYLRQAIETNPEADIAVSLTQAELQLAHHQTEHALATLTRLHGLQPNHTYVMKLLSRLYAELEDWNKLATLLPQLRRRRALRGEKLERLERRTAIGRITAAQAQEADLVAIWDSLPKGTRSDSRVMQAFVRRLVDADATALAEKRLRQHLNRHWDEMLVREYGLIVTENSSRQLDHAERWAGNHGRSPMLLLTLGRLSGRNRLWGKARSCFEASLSIAPRAETFLELAELLEQLGETGVAREHYRKGLAHAVTELGEGHGRELVKTEVERADPQGLPAPATTAA